MKPRPRHWYQSRGAPHGKTKVYRLCCVAQPIFPDGWCATFGSRSFNIRGKSLTGGPARTASVWARGACHRAALRADPLALPTRTPPRHCERSEAIPGPPNEAWIASSLPPSLDELRRTSALLAMTAATPCLPALSPPALDRNLRQDRHRDFLRRDGAEVEAGGGLDAVEGGGGAAFRDQIFAKRCPLSAAAAA